MRLWSITVSGKNMPDIGVDVLHRHARAWDYRFSGTWPNRTEMVSLSP